MKNLRGGGGRLQVRHAGSSGRSGVALVAVAGFGIWKAFFAGPGVPAGVIAVSDRIEGDEGLSREGSGGR